MKHIYELYSNDNKQTKQIDYDYFWSKFNFFMQEFDKIVDMTIGEIYEHRMF